MKNSFLKILTFIISINFLSGCARDLSSDMYTSDSTLSLTMEGVIVSARPVKIKETDRPEDNVGGMLTGGAMGAVIGSNIGKGKGNTAAIVGTTIAGAALGSIIHGKMKESKGIEYLVKVDASAIKNDYYEGNAAMRNAIAAATTSGLITVVQAVDKILSEGQRVYVIFSGNRTRVIPATNLPPANNYGNRFSNHYDNRPDNYNNRPNDYYDNRYGHPGDRQDYYNNRSDNYNNRPNDYYDNRNNDYGNRSNDYRNKSDNYDDRAGNNNINDYGYRNEAYDQRTANNLNNW